MSFPWMPLWIADYLKKTSHLRALESGAYLHLIMAYWIADGHLPDDDRQLATIAKVTDREWRAIKPTIAAFFLPGWKHERIDEELAEARANAENASKKGKAGAAARWSKQCQSNATGITTSNAMGNARAMPEPMPGDAPSPSPSPSKKDIRTVAKATRPTNEDFEKFWKAYPKRKGANPKAPAEKLFTAATKAGIDPAAIVAALMAGAGYDADKIGTEYIPQAVKWLRDRRWEEYTPANPEAVEERARFMAERGYEWRENRWQKLSNQGEAA